MPSLKSLRNRIGSVKSTRKITSAMKMVAGAKLRRATEQAEAARPYAVRMERMLAEVAASLKGMTGAPPLMIGTGKDDAHLLVVVTSDRGLCGAFNASVVRDTRKRVKALTDAGKTVKLLCVGRKGRDLLRRDYGRLMVGQIEGVGRPRLTYGDADRIANRVLAQFSEGGFDVCTLVFNEFRSVVSQVTIGQQLVPFAPPPAAAEAGSSATAGAIVEFEPDEEEILARLLPRNLGVQIYRALLESQAGEHGARMRAMDNATRNAGDMINRLTLVYNRTRQATITKELIEIISGAEAV